MNSDNDRADPVIGDIEDARVTGMHHYGIDVQTESGHVGVVDIRFINDDPRFMNMDRFPAIGSQVRVRFHGYGSRGQLRFTMRESDMKGDWAKYRK